LLLVGLRATFEAIQQREIDDVNTISGFAFRALLSIALVTCRDKFAAGLSLAGSETSLTGFMAYLIAQTFAVSFGGFWFGKKVGSKVESAAELIAGAIFVVLGLVIIYQTWSGGKSIV